jgi:hypothetical protein
MLLAIALALPVLTYGVRRTTRTSYNGYQQMNVDELRQIIGRKPFRAVEIATASGDHYQLVDETYVLNSPRRPELFVLFTEDGLMHLVDADQVVSASVL